jgi:hypothetical protein
MYEQNYEYPSNFLPIKLFILLRFVIFFSQKELLRKTRSKWIENNAYNFTLREMCVLCGYFYCV